MANNEFEELIRIEKALIREKLDILTDVSLDQNGQGQAIVREDREGGMSLTLPVYALVRMKRGRVLLYREPRDIYDVLRIGPGVNSSLREIPTLGKFIVPNYSVQLPGESDLYCLSHLEVLKSGR